MSNSRTQDGRSEQSAEQRRRKRKEGAARARAPEPRDIVSGAGQPLDPGVRRELEERLGHDLSRVRLHTGPDAGRLAELLERTRSPSARTSSSARGRTGPARTRAAGCSPTSSCTRSRTRTASVRCGPDGNWAR